MHFPDWVNAIILGIVEGLTEFLPVSSTGHLMVTGKWLGFDSEVFEVFIQIGALAAVWWLYRHRLLAMAPWNWSSNPAMKHLSWNVILAFLPAAVIGFATHHWIKEHLFTPQAIAWAFIVGGVVIVIVEWFKPLAVVEAVEGITPTLALAIGFGQCLALYPGVSRSGATIMTGLVLGLRRGVATEFTFLLAVPTMTAAALYELVKYRHDLNSSMITLLVIGLVVSYISALLVVKWFIRFVQGHTFNGFAAYRVVAGVVLLYFVSKGFFHP